jgi:hypothetical protein
MALLLLLGAMASAHAQIGGGHGRRQNNQLQTRHQSPPPTTPFLPEIWPRLEFAPDSPLEETGFELGVPLYVRLFTG